jgi:PAS domain S-box-containing protein
MTDTENNKPPSPATPQNPDDGETFMLRAARVLSGARRETMFEDLARAAAELLDAEVGLLGRYVEEDGVPSINILACFVDGRFSARETYPLAGTPCATVVGQEFRFYPDRVGYLFPESSAKDNAIAGYAAFPLFGDDGGQLGLFTVMSYRPMKDPARAESLLRIFSERAVAEIRRIEAEDALRASEERYRKIFNASVDGLSLLSPDGVIVDVNIAIERMYGYSRAEMVGENALRFTYGAGRDNAVQFLDAVRDNNFAIMVDKAMHRDGREFYIEPRGVTVEYRNRPHILAIIRDVTERMESEQQRATLETQLRQAQKMEAIGHLTGGVAHDFNNILTSVLGYVELAHDHVDAMQDDAVVRW